MAALEIIVKVLLALAMVAFVGYPFLRPTREEEPSITPRDESLRERSVHVETALREVEFDYRTGKLPEKDYQELTARYRRELAEVSGLLGLAQPAALEVEDVEPAAPAHEDEATGGEPEGSACPACEAVNPEGAKFCAACGERMGGATSAKRRPRKPQASTCSECGAEFQPGNKFCGSCGAKASGR